MYPLCNPFQWLRINNIQRSKGKSVKIESKLALKFFLKQRVIYLTTGSFNLRYLMLMKDLHQD